MNEVTSDPIVAEVKRAAQHMASGRALLAAMRWHGGPADP
jgi:hypothetical protein